VYLVKWEPISRVSHMTTPGLTAPRILLHYSWPRRYACIKSVLRISIIMRNRIWDPGWRIQNRNKNEMSVLIARPCVVNRRRKKRIVLRLSTAGLCPTLQHGRFSNHCRKHFFLLSRKLFYARFDDKRDKD